jgi:hypothetical protein
MKFLIFDTETTGLPKSQTSALQGPNNWPHIVSISWVLLDTYTNQILSQKNFIIKPMGWTIPDESIAIHKITNEEASKGSNLRDVILELMNEPYDAIVAHNIHFDINVLINAIRWDLHMQAPLRPRMFCTMKLSKDLCKLKGTFGRFKYPKLKELYFHAFHEIPNESQLHGSMYDVLILTKIIQEYTTLRRVMGLGVSDVTSVTNGVHAPTTLSFNFKEPN